MISIFRHLKAFSGHSLMAGRVPEQKNVFNYTTQCEYSGEIRQYIRSSYQLSAVRRE